MSPRRGRRLSAGNRLRATRQGTVAIIIHKSYYDIMRITLSIPEAVARRFQATVPARQRSRLVTRLLQQELAERDDALAAACRAANRDKALRREIGQWQAFDDGIGE